MIPFSLSRKPLEEIEISQVNFMVERLPWARIETGSGIKPWPSYLPLQGKSPLAVVAKPGTRILYSWPIRKPVQLDLLCGVSPDSYAEGAADPFDFTIRQLEADGRILNESRITLQPGIKKEDRDWKPVSMVLRLAPGGVLDFQYSCVGRNAAGTGAFAQPFLKPVNQSQ